jgi:hypothetical protein
MTADQHHPPMIDLIYLVTLVAFFVVSAAYANGCETL